MRSEIENVVLSELIEEDDGYLCEPRDWLG